MNKQILLNGLIFLLCYLILVGHSLDPQSALDTYWHLQMGRDLLENGLSPWRDHYSFTFNGQNISSVPIVFQTLLAFYVSTFGEISGFIIFKLSYVTVLLFVIYRFFRQIKAPWYIVYLILPILTYFVHMRLIIRPDTISNILIVICLSLYLKARENFATKELISISLLLLFWVNYHTPILGYIIIFGLFLDRAIYKLFSKDDKFTWGQWFFWGALYFLIGFINPKFQHVLILVFSMSSEWYQYLSEYLPSYMVYSTNKMVYLLWAASIYVVFWAIIKKQYGFAFIAAVLGYYSWTILRLIPAVSLINFCILAYFLSQLDFNRLYINIRPALRVVVVVFSLSLFVFTLHQATGSAFDKLQSIKNYSHHVLLSRQIMNKRFPVQVSDYLISFQNSGNIINSFNTGGYLIYALSPDFKVFIDGRTNILYPLEFYKHYIRVISDTDILEKDIRKYNVKFALFKNTLKAQDYFKDTNLLDINFADEDYVLYSTENDVAFPVASKLTLFPMCWSDRYYKEVQKEIILSENLFSGKSYVIKYILKLLNDYSLYEDKAKFINSLQSVDLQFDATKRLASYLAININSFEMANVFLRSIDNKKNDDYLMMAYSSAMAGNLVTAKVLLGFYINKKENTGIDSLTKFDKIVIFKILNSILQKSEEQFLSSSDVLVIKKTLKLDEFEYAQSLIPGLPYNEICNSVFSSY